MATVEERMRVLRMVEEGKITAEDGARLLAAMGGADRSGRPGKGGRSGSRAGAGRPGTMRVRVTDAGTGKSRANVSIPLSIVQLGLRLGRRFAPMDVDLGGIDIDELMEAIDRGATGRIVETYDDDQRIEVFIE